MGRGVDHANIEAQKSHLPPGALKLPFHHVAGDQPLHLLDVAPHVGNADRTNPHGAPGGEAGGNTEIDTPGASALSDMRALAATGAMRFEGISTPVPRRILDVVTAAAPMATKISAFSNCVS